MSSIQTSIELNDQFSGVLNNIISSVNLAVSAMYDLSQSMNADIDTSSIEGARDEINQATVDWTSESSLSTHNHTVKGDNGSGGNIDLNTGSKNLAHTHKITGKKKIIIHNGLAVGDEVILIRQQEGQRFIVVDRIGK